MMHDYFISPRGDDTQSGDRHFPWRTLARANAHIFEAGDRLLLEGGETFFGSLLFLRGGGTSESPVTITSYGKGRATIASERDGALLIRNASGFVVADLECVGGVGNETHGVCLYADRESNDDSRKWISICLRDLEIHGFGCAGVALGSANDCGYRDVVIERVHSHHNGYAGILAWGGGQDYAHEDITVRASTTAFNSGRPGLLHPSGHGIHSGHGVLLSCVDRALIEKCISHDNGTLNLANHCGPAGIWVSNSRRVHMLRNESFRNRTASAADGGGFGLDGGVSDSLMEKNFSHDNDGPGFLFSQYWGARSFRNNAMIENVSENDARRNDNGAIHAWAPSDDVMENLLIKNNKITVRPNPEGRPRALLIDARTRGLRLLENRFDGGSAPIVMEISPLQTDWICRFNTFAHSKGGVLWQGRFYKEVAGWLNAVPQTQLREAGGVEVAH